MTLIGTPAHRPTPDCIWNSFRSSGKRHLILTGGRGIGKTTMLSQLCTGQMPGVTTWAVPGTGVYLKEVLSGEIAQIGIFDSSLPGTENRMRLQAEGVYSLAIPALGRCRQADSEWITIDEIGYLESESHVYQEMLRRLMEEKRIIAVVRKQELPFLQELREHPEAFVVDLDAPYGNIGCVIMASGLGKRFGGNKLMADFRGVPLISRIFDATEGIFARRVVITRHESVAELCRERSIEVVRHHLPHRSDTVRLGLEALGNTVKRCMFCAGDQPLLQQETVAAVALASANIPDAIWRTVYGDIAGSPVVFPVWAFPELRNLPEGKGGGVLIKKYPERLHTVNARDLYELKDVDSPEDMEELLER